FDGGVFEYAVNGGAYKRLESTVTTTPGRVSFTLPAAADHASVTLRFRAMGDVSNETYTVNNIVVTGTLAGSGGQAVPPAVGEFTTFESGHVRPMALSADGTRLYVVN